MNRFLQDMRRDYRHVICSCITLLFLGMGFLFPNAIPRLAETVRDFCVSIAYYFCEIIVPNSNPIRPTVLDIQSWRFGEQIWKPIELFPYTWEEFSALWLTYWKTVFSKENFSAYMDKLGDGIFVFSRLSLVLLPLIACIIVRIKGSNKKRCTTRNKKSKPLQIFEKFLFRVIYPFVARIKSFVAFCKENAQYYTAWLVLWMLYLNVFSILIAFVAFYLYFAVAWDAKALYTQALKLLTDLTPAIRFIPGIVWLILGAWLYNYICRSMAFVRLYYYERCNRAVLRERGIVTVVYGEMGIGKTQLITSMALSSEVEQFDMAFEIMIEKDMMFPNFPWQPFRDELRRRIDNREIVDLPTCRAFVQRCRIFFDRISAVHTAEEYQEKRRRYKLLKKDYTFGYDYTHYATTYNDELKITHLYEALEDYACAYLIFTVQTTLLFSNYSIRVDSILKDLGNMPSRNNDFFDRDPKCQEAYSHHAHIIDIDMIRLGRKIIKGNPKARRFSFGTFVITEIDKEFKNQLELKETKINAEETNQKNDLHNACLMMCRHAAVVSNRVFIRFICDLQRPEAWGAGGRELGEVIYISEKSDLSPALPFFSPYWLLQGVFSGIKSIWQHFDAEYDVNRSDTTLSTFAAANTISKINNHYDKVHGLFGTQTLKLEIQSGRLEGEVKNEKWRLIMKKDRSRRYRTACLEAVFDSYEPNFMHIDDFIMYAGEVGTQEENALQNSYFQNDIAKMKMLNQ